jgi:hypothetical protein
MTDERPTDDALRQLLILIEDALLDTLDRVRATHLPTTSPCNCRRVYLSALIELTGRMMAAQILDDGNERELCTELIVTLGSFLMATKPSTPDVAPTTTH